MSENSRKGFTKATNKPEWFIEGEQLCWKNPVRHSIPLSQLRFMNFDSYDSVYSKKETDKNHLRGFIELIKHPSRLTQQQKYDLLHSSSDLSPKAFIKISEELLPSKKWSDGEKLVFLNSNLPNFSGQRYGKELNKILYQISWNSKSFIKRMNDFNEIIKKYDERRIDDLMEDQKVIDEFGDRITIYRGFNVPNDESIRPKNTKQWLKQESGKSIYFTTSPEVARWFACTQKLEVIQKPKLHIEIDKHDNKLLQSRIVLAKYKASLDDVIIYHNNLGRKEQECIILPANTELKNYQFLGFDDFINTVNGKRHWEL